jgi:Flp pilus assembly protein TadB
MARIGGKGPQMGARGAKASTRVRIESIPKAKEKKPKPPPREPDDLAAALPFFLIRFGVFVVITVVLWFAVGLNPLFAVLFGLIVGAVVTWPIARMQKRAARAGAAKPAAGAAAKPAGGKPRR